MRRAARHLPLKTRDGVLRDHTLLDEEDYWRVGGFHWYLGGGGYAACQFGRYTTLLHRHLLGLRPRDGKEVDHINQDKLDNRRFNLRVVTRSEQVQNVPARGGTSRFRGVSWANHMNCWRATSSTPERRCVHLGYFEDEIEAASVAEEFRRKHLPFALPDPELAEVLA